MMTSPNEFELSFIFYSRYFANYSSKTDFECTGGVILCLIVGDVQSKASAGLHVWHQTQPVRRRNYEHARSGRNCTVYYCWRTTCM